MTQERSAQPAAPTPNAAATTEAAPRGRGINEDWLATIVGLVLIVLVLLGIIGKGIVP